MSLATEIKNRDKLTQPFLTIYCDNWQLCRVIKKSTVNIIHSLHWTLNVKFVWVSRRKAAHGRQIGLAIELFRRCWFISSHTRCHCCCALQWHSLSGNRPNMCFWVGLRAVVAVRRSAHALYFRRKILKLFLWHSSLSRDYK